MNKIIIIGGGASGIMSAITAKNENNNVVIIEKNKNLGQKLAITGSSRCNITNIDSKEDFFENIVSNPKFFYSSFSKMSNYDFIDFLEKIGINLKYEGIRAYPIFESAQKVVNIFTKILEEKNIEVKTNEEMIDIVVENNKISKIVTNKDTYTDFTDVIIATGGMSYTTNKTFDILKKYVNIVNLYPALVCIETIQDFSDLAGLSVSDVLIKNSLNEVAQKGDMLFTLKGLSGPSIINMSSYISSYQDTCNKNYVTYKNEKVFLSIDFLPNIEYNEIYDMLFDNTKKLLKTKLSNYLPSKLSKFLLQKYDNIDIHNIKKEEKEDIVDKVKKYKVQIKKYGNIKSAIVTKGGVDTKCISSSNMRCKFIDNLYFAGECIDIDALTGGYNLQLAFSTGYVAGLNFI